MACELSTAHGTDDTARRLLLHLAHQALVEMARAGAAAPVSIRVTGEMDRVSVDFTSTVTREVRTVPAVLSRRAALLGAHAVSGRTGNELSATVTVPARLGAVA